MASHIVSWGGGVRCASPALSVLSIASFESSLTDTHLTSSSALDALRAKHPALDDLKLPADERDGFEEPFERHDKWFFKDGNITFLVRMSFDRDWHVLTRRRSTACCTACTDTSSPATRNTSQTGSTSSAYASTRPCPPSYPYRTSSGRTLMPSSPSYTPSTPPSQSTPSYLD
ncbi:hypothetical protein BC834DRAFT_400106 [Gloeopeniophorella convolvens]|nr:hypothetical protein BC834DRAFT_400106 [Gloeopeniophorella convolvens]